MPPLTKDQKKLLGKLIDPFERSKKDPELKTIRDGERERDPFTDKIYDGVDNKKPPDCVTLSLEEVEKHIKTKGRYKEKCFLWVLDDVSIKIIREKTLNTLRTHDSQYVCHTNLTGAGRAYVGGEMFFGQDGNIYINPFSDRYGNPPSQTWQVALDYIRSVGYSDLIDIMTLLPKN